MGKQVPEYASGVDILARPPARLLGICQESIDRAVTMESEYGGNNQYWQSEAYTISRSCPHLDLANIYD